MSLLFFQEVCVFSSSQKICLFFHGGGGNNSYCHNDLVSSENNGRVCGLQNNTRWKAILSTRTLRGLACPERGTHTKSWAQWGPTLRHSSHLPLEQRCATTTGPTPCYKRESQRGRDTRWKEGGTKKGKGKRDRVCV